MFGKAMSLQIIILSDPLMKIEQKKAAQKSTYRSREQHGALIRVL